MKIFKSITQSIFKVCPKSGKIVGVRFEKSWKKWLFPIAGLAALIWFLVRVIPKPTRAEYPCQRVAAPIAFSFLGYIVSLSIAVFGFRKARKFFKQFQLILALVFILVAAAGVFINMSLQSGNIFAASTGTFTPIDKPNSPMGTAKGIFPGRVAWAHDPTATSWDGTSNYWWSDQYNNQTVIKGLLDKVVNSVAGGSTVNQSWDILFRDLNKRRGKGDVGYTNTETIVIKINENNNGTGNGCDASPHMVYALLEQLVNQIGVPQQNITVYDAQRPTMTNITAHCAAAFPEVNFKVSTDIKWVSNIITFSSPEITDSNLNRLPDFVVNADYFINMAILKRHCKISSSWSDSDGQTGVTLCGKNNNGTFGSPSAIHVTIRDWNRGMGKYNPLVDYIGSKYTGGKTVLYIIDGLYGGDHHNAVPMKWKMAPFNNDWPSSAFSSQDPVAIDSVGLDFLNTEWGLVANADNYLHEAAQANNPPSGIVYKPDGVRLSSLGVHEHWNNATAKEYSRNLGTGSGIELVDLSESQPTSLKYECESLTATTSGPAVTVQTDSGASGGANSKFMATAVGDWVQYTVNVATAGTYDIKVCVRKNTDKGICQTYIGGVAQGGTIDLYASASAYVVVDIGSKTLSAGNNLFKFQVTGKNASSSGYALSLDYILLTPQ